ncbi:DUF309 domain-containing protein [Staphylococcus muscae]|uniref:Putative cytosolic protein n=1 Tax=Staphylococcus muscae TaxID=1294 RepID=A0A240C3T4_9STAP|nr:DUF309 domain-containing protein [Staphylococcus muscae]AVQ33127.1 DUF309 domain-containing protein [Staphylococcus muscae]PNZ04734.1 DUF309 domain-containing protein [Staphylococcus muscae]GGA88161.1 hypothetical protein GCM10007183_10420 [Staphylococcus muscae]SNW02590.1 Putative cytosolic protein [Staphylococcus muscae]
MQDALLTFYYQFHTKQHYFLCHDILEDAWKQQNHYTKDDFVVGLILFATASYHYRRCNLKGALRTFKKSIKIINQYADESIASYGLQPNAFRKQIQQLCTDIEQEKCFRPIELPLLKEMEQSIKSTYNDYVVNTTIVDTPDIMHYHRLRDRTPVIDAREKALRLRRMHGNNKKD